MSALPRREVRNVGLAALVLGVAPLFVLGSSYYVGVLAHLVIVAMFAVALNVVFGETDQLFLFMGGLAGIGAYGTALLTDWTGVTAWLTVLVAALAAGVLGVAVSWISAKRNFTVVLISILTLNLQLVLSEVFVGARDVTGGSTGFSYRYFSLSAVADPLGVGDKVVLYYASWLLLVGLLLLYVWLVHSRYGAAFDAIREDEIAAASIGVDVVRYKVVAGFLGAFVFGLVGAFYVRETARILPGNLTFLTVDVLVLIVLIVGGLRTTLGPVVGAVIVTGLEEFLAATAAEWRTAIFGVLLVLLFIYFRSGVVAACGGILERYRPGAGGGTRARAD